MELTMMGKAEKSNKPRIRKGARKRARKGWVGNVKRPNTDKQKTAPNTFIEYIDLILLVPFRSLGVFALWKCWPFKETTIIDDIGEASGLPWLARTTLMLWGGLELFAFWKRWPSKGESKPVLPLTSIDIERNIKDEMAEQKRKFEQMLEGKNDQIDEGQRKLSELKKENSELVSKLKRSEQNLRDTNKELSDVRDMKNDAEAKTKQRNNQIHQLQMKQKELVSTLEQTESESKNVFDDLLIAKKQLHDTEEKLFEVREQKRDTEGKLHDALLRSGEVVSDIFFDKNPDIVHLSDEYRPTKLAEMFSELYDNEWTAAYTVMEDEQFQDRHMIDFLLDVVMESYVFCKNEVDNSWNVVSKWFLDDGLPKVQQMRNALKYGRKVIVLKLLPEIEQKYTSYIKSICRHEPLKKLLSIEDIRKYMALCLKLTFLMNANDPPVYLECSGWKPIRDRDKIVEEKENNNRPLPEASIDPDASSPTNNEHDKQKPPIFNNKFEETPETTRHEDEKDMPESNSPNSRCELPDEQLKHENDNDYSKQIYAGEVSNEEIKAAPRGEFEKDKYKEYTTRGKYTEFHVWPIMYLHKGGPMLGKGIAQGVKDSKAEPSDKPWAWWE